MNKHQDILKKLKRKYTYTIKLNDPIGGYCWQCDNLKLIQMFSDLRNTDPGNIKGKVVFVLKERVRFNTAVDKSFIQMYANDYGKQFKCLLKLLD